MTNGREIVFRTPWFDIATVEPGDEPSGTTDPYYCLIRRAGVLAFVLDATGNVVLVEQYRPPVGRPVLEMPAGGIDEGETAHEAVAREVLEETGFVCDSWHEISPFRLMPNREDVIDYFYIGLGARKFLDYEAVEGGVTRVIPRPEFVELLKTRRFEQVAALGGLYLAERILGVDLLTADLGQIEAKLKAGT